MHIFNFKYLALTITIAFCSGCGKNETTFPVKLTVPFEVPVGLNTIETHIFIEKNILTLYDQNLVTNNLTDIQVTRVTGGKAQLSSKFNAQDLNFISRISIFAVDAFNPHVSYEMFYLDQVSFNQGAVINLLPAVSDVKSILKNNRFNIEIRLNFRSPPPTNLILDLDLEYLLYI